MAFTTTIIESLQDSVGNKGLMIFLVALVYLAAILVINVFVQLKKWKSGIWTNHPIKKKLTK